MGMYERRCGATVDRVLWLRVHTAARFNDGVGGDPCGLVTVWGRPVRLCGRAKRQLHQQRGVLLLLRQHVREELQRTGDLHVFVDWQAGRQHYALHLFSKC